MAKKSLSDRLVFKTFVYDGFDPELKGKLICLMGEINAAKRRHIGDALLMGEAISLAQSLLADHSKHGRFGEWIERECNIGRSTAYNYMHAWERFKDCEHIDQINDGAMYLLSAPSAPKGASLEAAKLAKKGIKVTVEQAKSIIKRFRQPKSQLSNEDAEPSVSPEENHTESPTSSKEPEVSATPLAETPDEDFDPASIEALPSSTIDVNALAGPYRAWVRQLNACGAEFEGLAADQKIGVHLCDKITRLKGYLQQARETISQMEPVCACEWCDGAGCKTCFGSGFWTRVVRGSRKQ